MTATTGAETAASAAPRPVRRPRLRLVAWVLLAGWLGTAVAAVLQGQVASDVGSLRDAIAAGEVDRVEVTGGLGPHARGNATVELRWSDNGLHYYAEVVQTRRPRGAAWDSDNVTGRFTGNLAAYLNPKDADLEIVRSHHSNGGVSAGLAGFRLSGGTAWLMLGMFLSTIVMLVVADEPWRATRWAWFWLLLALPGIAAPAYLLFGGATGVAPPKRPAARLTGGWAFLLSLLIGTAWTGVNN